MERPFEASIILNSFDNSDVLGFWVLPSCLIVNIHPAATSALDLNRSAIYFHVISIDRGYRHSCGSASCPPFNKQFNYCLFHLTNWFLILCTVDIEQPVSFAVFLME